MEKQAAFKALKNVEMLKLYNKNNNCKLANELQTIYEKFSDYEDEVVSSGKQGLLTIFSSIHDMLKCNKRFVIFNKIFNKYAIIDNGTLVGLNNPNEYIHNHIEMIALPNTEADNSPRRDAIIKSDDMLLKEINKTLSQEQ